MNKIKVLTGGILTVIGITTASFTITGNAILSISTSAQSIASLTLFVAGVFMLRAGILENRIHFIDEMQYHPGLQKIADKLPQDTKKEAQHLMYQFQKGNTSVGRGARYIGDGISELRGGKNARVYYIPGNKKGDYKLVGISDKNKQERTISLIRKTYTA